MSEMDFIYEMFGPEHSIQQIGDAWKLIPDKINNLEDRIDYLMNYFSNIAVKKVILNTEKKENQAWLNLLREKNMEEAREKLRELRLEKVNKILLSCTQINCKTIENPYNCDPFFIAAYEDQQEKGCLVQKTSLWSKADGQLHTITMEKYNSLKNFRNQDQEIIHPFSVAINFKIPIEDRKSFLVTKEGRRDLDCYQLKTFCTRSNLCFLKEILFFPDSKSNETFCLWTPICIQNFSSRKSTENIMPPFIPLSGKIVEEIGCKTHVVVNIRFEIGIHSHYFFDKEYVALNPFMRRIISYYHVLKIYNSIPLNFSWKNTLNYKDLKPYHLKEHEKEDASVASMMKFARNNPLVKNLLYRLFEDKTPKEISEMVGLSPGHILLPYQIEMITYMLFQENQPLSLFEQNFVVGQPAAEAKHPDVKLFKGKRPFRFATQAKSLGIYESEQDKTFSKSLAVALRNEFELREDEIRKSLMEAMKYFSQKDGVNDYELEEEEEKEELDEEKEFPKRLVIRGQIDADMAFSMVEKFSAKLKEKDKYLNKLSEDEIRKRKGGVLAAEMRLGKTWMTCALESYQRKISKTTRPSLYIAPSPVINNSWLKGFEELTPHLKVLNLDNMKIRDKFKTGDDEKVKVLFDAGKYDVVLMAFSTPALFPSQSFFHTLDYERIVIDECHKLSAINTQRFFSLTELKSKYFWCLTGSPFTGAQGIGKLGPLLNLAYGKVINNTSYLKMNMWSTAPELLATFKNWVQHGMIVLSSTQDHVKEETKERNLVGKMHFIQTSNHPEFVKYYKSLLDFGSIGRDYSKDKLSLQDVHFFNSLRKACSSSLELTELLDKKLKSMGTEDIKETANNLLEKFGILEELKGDYVVLKGDGNDVGYPMFEGEKSDCMICLEEFKNPFLLPCKHIVCQLCLKTIIDTVKNDAVLKASMNGFHLNCPACKKAARETELKAVIFKKEDEKREDSVEGIKVIIYESQILSLLQSAKDGDKTSTAALIGLHSLNHPKPLYAIQLLTSYLKLNEKKPLIKEDSKKKRKMIEASPKQKKSKKSKVFDEDVMVDDVKEVIVLDDSDDDDDDDDSAVQKIVVFSDFSDSIKSLANVMKSHSRFNGTYLLYVNEMTQTRKANVFQQFCDVHSPYRILLINSKSGSVGLDLSVATHIIALEPFLSKADEEQAMSRTYNIRKDQKRFIDYLVLADTVEESIVKEMSTVIEMKEIITSDIDSKGKVSGRINKQIEIAESSSSSSLALSAFMQDGQQINEKRKKSMQLILNREVFERKHGKSHGVGTRVMDYSLRGFK